MPRHARTQTKTLADSIEELRKNVAWSEEEPDSYITEGQEDEDTYYNELSNEKLKLSEVLDRLVLDGKINNNTIIQIGAASCWMWITTYEKYLRDFKDYADRANAAAKDEYSRLNKIVDQMINKERPEIIKNGDKNVNNTAEYATRMINWAERLRSYNDARRDAQKTVGFGRFYKRMVIEVYPSILNNSNILIRIKGDEKGRYWDESEVNPKDLR
jgi:hypothetical protein